LDIFLYVVGIIIAAFLLAGALVLTMYCYLNYCSKHPMRKLKAEVVVILIVCVASLAVRMAIGFASLPHDAFIGGAESLLHGVLSTVAGLMLDGPSDPSDFELANGVLVCFYYGIIAYAGFVFLSVITVGISYEFYSRVQTAFMRCRKRCTYYIFTSVNKESLVLAEDIKKEEQAKKGHSYVILFFDRGEETFSRKNPLHRRIMQNGFYYFSEPRCTDKGETISFLSRFKFKVKHCLKDDIEENRGKLFYVFAMDNSGDYEMDNADVIFDDLQATLKAYVYQKEGLSYNEIPTVINYYVLTSGEVNYESYERRTKEILSKHLAGLPKDFYWNASSEKPNSLGEYIDSEIQINVVNEATLSSHSLVLARNAHLNNLGVNAFSLDSEADDCGAYRVAVIGFGKTGQYTMEELYTHTTKLIKKDGGYVPTQFIADIYDTDIDEKSGLFAYNHPLFRCIDKKSAAGLSDTDSIIAKAKSISGKAIETLYSEYMEKSGKSFDEAKEFIDAKMAFPIAIMHEDNAFGYPFLAEEGTEAAVLYACKNGIRDFIVALGSDERNIATANMLIDSFRRLFLAESSSNEKCNLPHVKIYVNLIEERNRSLINWRWEEDSELYSHPYKQDEKGELCDYPRLSVIPFGFREEMYSYSTLIEDYKDRIYNYGYNLLAAALESGEKGNEKYDNFKSGINADYNKFRKETDAIDEWMKLSQYFRLSNKSARDFAINYYKYKEAHSGSLSDEDWQYLIRLEHERWNRFFISHGWIYAPYYKNINSADLSADEKKKAEKKEKGLKRGVRQHNCLCPFDEMFDEKTKAYDRGNVELGMIEGIVYGR